jgi:hypothetical protein
MQSEKFAAALGGGKAEKRSAPTAVRALGFFPTCAVQVDGSRIPLLRGGDPQFEAVPSSEGVTLEASARSPRIQNIGSGHLEPRKRALQENLDDGDHAAGVVLSVKKMSKISWTLLPDGHRQGLFKRCEDTAVSSIHFRRLQCSV